MNSKLLPMKLKEAIRSYSRNLNAINKEYKVFRSI
jgi:hypothetical protein